MFDSFDCTPFGVSAESGGYVKYVRSFVFSVNWLDELRACREGGSIHDAHGVIFRKYFEHPAPMNGLLAYIHGVMMVAQPKRATFHQQRMIEYLLRCFKDLRALIDQANQSDEQMMLILQTLWPLTVLEYSESVINGGDRTFQHRAVLLQLVQERGGFQLLSPLYREMFVNFFFKVAIMTEKPNEIDPAMWDPGPWQGSLPLLESSDVSTSTSSSVANLSTLPGIFAALREVVAVEVIKRSRSWSDADHLGPVFRWTYQRRLALKMRLWDALQSSPTELAIAVTNRTPNALSLRPDDASHASLDTCLCIAAQLFMYLSLETRPIRKPWFRAPMQYEEMLSQIKAFDCVLGHYVRDMDVKTLKAHLKSTSPDHRPCPQEPRADDLLWIVAVGACFEEERDRHENRLGGFVKGETAVSAGFVDYDDEDEDQAQTETQMQKQKQARIEREKEEVQRSWFSRRFGILARRLGYAQFDEVRELFATTFAYDAMILDPTLSAWFAWVPSE